MKLTLTDFTDISAQSLARKASKVREVRARSVDAYSPAKDFYKQLRDAIVSLHREGGTASDLEQLLFKVKDIKRRRRYSLLIPSYKSWLGKRQFDSITPPSARYQYKNAQISINPELALKRGKLTYVIKLYFKTQELQKPSAELITGLMSLALKRDEGVIYAVLDVERGKFLLEKRSSTEKVTMMVNAELAYIIDMWESLEKAA
jgi:hypothetical protein